MKQNDLVILALAKTVSPRIGLNINGQWGHAHAMEDRRVFLTVFDAQVHRGYVQFFKRRGVNPPPVDCSMVESIHALQEWAAHAIGGRP